jgi:hypothetical protein
MMCKLKAFQVSNFIFYICHFGIHTVAISNINEQERTRMVKKEGFVNGQNASGKI